jgi:protein-S-isoprenylcysteine O-methyltransferase Ste14
VSPPFWINAALRSVIWLGFAGGLAYFKKPDGASFLAVRTDALGWLGGGAFLAGLALHVWSNLSLARGERQGSGGANGLVTDGPFRYVRNPIYLAGITLLLGVALLYSTRPTVDLVLPLLLFVYFHLSVVLVEEPALRRSFGSTYEEYRKRVPRWLPVPTSSERAAQQGDAAGGPSRRS